jgi:NAD(P)-dependent dehydrogenase (short-subunit alcohol dehydrogenase family)
MAANHAQCPEPARFALPSGRPRLLGKVAVVTGGNRGIGYAVAKTLAGEGCSVVITGRDQSALKKSSESISLALPHGVAPDAEVRTEICDIRDPESVKNLFTAVGERFGRVDILVNNAGISQAPTTVEGTSVELWRSITETNLTGMFLCTKAALPLMTAGATIINNISAAAKQVFPDFCAYTAAKTGAYGFTLAIREEVKARGIRVTALIAGATATDIWEQIMPDAARDGMIDVESVAQGVLYAVLLPPQANLSELRIDPISGGL